MSWHKAQISDPSGFITGNIYYDIDSNLFLWFEDGLYRIASTLGRILQDTDQTTAVVTTWYSHFWACNGPRIFANHAVLSSATYYLWYSNTFAVYYISQALYGFNNTTAGNWANVNLISTFGPNAPATHNRLTAWKTFDGWTSATLAGTYTASGSATGTKFVGSLAYTDTGHNWYRGQVGVTL